MSTKFGSPLETLYWEWLFQRPLELNALLAQHIPPTIYLCCFNTWILKMASGRKIGSRTKGTLISHRDDTNLMHIATCVWLSRPPGTTWIRPAHRILMITAYISKLLTCRYYLWAPILTKQLFSIRNLCFSTERIWVTGFPAIAGAFDCMHISKIISQNAYQRHKL